MKKNMLFIIMAGITFLFTACGKTQDSSNDVTEYVSQQETEQSESSTPQSDEVETLEPDEEEAIGDVDTSDDSFGRLTLDSMTEYSVGTAGDMVVPVSSRDTTVEDVVSDLKVMFPMKPYYEGEIESGNSYTQFIASNGEYNYQIMFNTIPTKGLRETKEEDYGILYEETDSYIIDVQHMGDMGQDVIGYRCSVINVYNKTSGVALEVRMFHSIEDDAKENPDAGARYSEYDEWVRANIDLIKSKLQ